MSGNNEITEQSDLSPVSFDSFDQTDLDNVSVRTFSKMGRLMQGWESELLDII